MLNQEQKRKLAEARARLAANGLKPHDLPVNNAAPRIGSYASDVSATLMAEMELDEPARKVEAAAR